MENKVKAAVYSDYKHFKLIEVNLDDVEKIKEINRMTWREEDAEKRRKKKLEEDGIIECSLDEYEEDGECIPSKIALDPLDKVIEKEELDDKKRLISQAMGCLTDRQRLVIIKYFFEKTSFREIAKELGVHFTSIQECLTSAIKKMKKFLENS